MPSTLLDKIWDLHTVRILPNGATQLFIGLHLIHEVTSPQAFAMLEEQGLPVLFPERTFATMDHIVPTDTPQRPYRDSAAEAMAIALEQACKRHGITLIDEHHRGIVHVIGPELGLTQPGLTIACGDSHTSTHGALGAIAFGIGTTQVRDVLATQTLAIQKPKLRRIEVNGSFTPGVDAKDLALYLIHRMGVKAGIGFAHEYAGSTIDSFTIEQRLTLCNMSIESGARFGYCNPDAKTVAYLRNRPYAPVAEDFTSA
ncbi:MAG: 3-isopropylmalate dehydratase large subunit, partial [Lentisphaerae bacterium]